MDDALIQTKRGVKRTLHPARRLSQPVLLPDRPWEGERVYLYGTVHFDAKARLFRMWYGTRLGPGFEKRMPGVETHGDAILYATSKDGLAWDKPDLGLHEFDGSTHNNIILPNFHAPSVYVDEADRDAPFKVAAWSWDPKAYGYWVGQSRDGVRWQPHAGVNPVFPPNGREILEVLSVARHPSSGRFFAYHRRWMDVGGHRRRVIAASSSPDFQNWSKPEVIVVPDAEDDRWVREPHQRTEFYNLNGFWYGNQFLGTLPVFRVVSQAKKAGPDGGSNQSTWDGALDAQLVHSRDGRAWHRFEGRAALIPNGPAGSYDAGAILGTSNSPIVHGDEVWLYYTAVNTTHGGPMPPKKITIARAAWRLDGFVSLDAGADEAVVETVPLKLAGRSLEVNANAHRGSVTVEVLSAEGHPLPGYSVKEAIRLDTDDVRHKLRWREIEKITVPAPVRLRFRLTNAQLYSLRVR